MQRRGESSGIHASGDTGHTANEFASARHGQELRNNAAHRRIGMIITAAVGPVTALTFELVIGARLPRIGYARNRLLARPCRCACQKSKSERKGEPAGVHWPPAAAWSLPTSCAESAVPVAR